MANWAYMMCGHAGSIQVIKSNYIPMQSGSMIEEVEKTNSTPRQPDGSYHLSKHMQAMWANIWKNKRYTQLPRKSTADYTYFFQYNTNNNTTIGNYSRTLSMNFKATQHIRNWFIGSNVYFLCRNGHHGGYFNDTMGKVDITINFFDGSNKTVGLQHSYCGRNEDFSSSVCEVKGLKGTESKDIKSITAVFSYKNGSGEWHGPNINNDQYKKIMTEKGGNSFSQQLIPAGIIDFIREFNFNFETTVTDSVKRQETVVF